MDAGEFLVPSPETLTSEDEQPSSAQKHPLITCHEKVSDDNLISFREKGLATLKPAQLDMNDTDNDSESEVEESSSDSSEEDEGGHAQLPEESSTPFLLAFISSMHFETHRCKLQFIAACWRYQSLQSGAVEGNQRLLLKKRSVTSHNI
jgi:hypothetical protein